MTKNIKKFPIFFILLAMFVTNTHAQQVQKGSLVDGITAVIGDEIVLESDLDEQMHYAQQQGIKVEGKCNFLDNMVNDKLLIYEAKRDTLIEDRSGYYKDIASKKYEQILSNFSDEKAMLAAYKFRTGYEMKNAIEKIDTDQYYREQKFYMITNKVDITPNEVTDFYNENKHQLPMINDEVSLSQIIMYPKLTEAHKDEIKAKLLRIKAEIKDGKTFEEMARIYSEDPGSASKGGLYTHIAKGQMVKPFEAAALTLDEGEISDPVESTFGYHLIQLIKKSGKYYDARHILIKATPTTEEIASSKKVLDSIRTLIIDGKLTFKEAAYKFSDDKNTKFNGGNMVSQDGTDKIEKMNLSPTLAYQIAGLKPNDITDVFNDELTETNDPKKVVAIVKINEEIPSHLVALETDYERVKNMALQRKKSQVLEKWVKEKLPDTFISINKRYDHCEFKSKWDKTK